MTKAISDEEKIEIYKIARNFQDSPKKVVRLLKEFVGVERLKLAIEYLESVAQ